MKKMWRKTTLSLCRSKFECDARIHIIFGQRRVSSYSKWASTKRIFLKENVFLPNNISPIEVIHDRYFLKSSSFHDILFIRKIYTDPRKLNRKRVQLPEGLFGESDPFSLNEESLSKYANCEPQKKTTKLVEVNIGLKGRVTEKHLEVVFPQTRCALNNFQTYMNKKIFDISFKHIPLKKKMKNTEKNPFWTCKLKLFISDPIEFEWSASTKNLASHTACLKALHWLFINNYMNNLGMPIHSIDEINELRQNINSSIDVNLSPDYQKRLEELIDTYNNKIFKLQLSSQSDLNNDSDKSKIVSLDEEDGLLFDDERNFENISKKDDVFGKPLVEKDMELLKNHSSILLKKLERRLEEKPLPITDYKYDIIRTIESNRAVVISGAPGCGKSTRVPSYILDHLTECNKGSECNILISQPRRVAATSLAKRVASERQEKIGDVCGYQVRFSTCLPKSPGGVLLYCTAGTLLKRLSFSPNLAGCSHLIIDEAHERSIDSDAVLTLAKQAMTLNPNLKVIVMSATLDTQLFSRYFGDCPILDIPGFTYPVKSFFLEDMPKELTLRLNKAWSSSHMKELKPTIDSDEVATVIKWLNAKKPEGAILVFLPGWREIIKVKNNLENDPGSSAFVVLPVHSRLSNEEQQKIFSHVPPGIRKIVLGTNIAETSITINDVSYVLDTGAYKEKTVIDEKGLSSLNNCWVSKANVKQRKGRAGRVKSGECYHLYTEEKMKSFDDNPLPEIFRISLEKTVMDCKIHNENESALSFLQKFPQPPSVDSIQDAIDNLTELGALDAVENLTPLGKRIVSFTTHPKLSKALILSTIFKVTSPVLIGATILSNNYDFFTCSIDGKSELRKVKKEYHPSSDHQALYWIYENYQTLKKEEHLRIVDSFCKERYIRKEKLDSIADTREIYVDHLRQCKMLNVSNYNKGKKFNDYDKYSNNDELIKGVLYSGLNSFLFVKTKVKTQGRLDKVYELHTETGQRAFLSAESINYKIEKYKNDAILLYYGGMHFEERRGVLIRESSLLSPVTVFLFSSNVSPVSSDENYTIYSINNNKAMLRCQNELADILISFRRVMWQIVDYYVKNRSLNSWIDIQKCENMKEIDEFWDNLLKNITLLLGETEIKFIEKNNDEERLE